MEAAKEFCCKDCKYFFQHYGKGPRGQYREIYCGHCIKPRLKNRKPDAPACPHFEQGKHR